MEIWLDKDALINGAINMYKSTQMRRDGTLKKVVKTNPHGINECHVDKNEEITWMVRWLCSDRIIPLILIKVDISKGDNSTYVYSKYCLTMV